MTRYYDPNRHHRRSIRLKGYDYTQPGAYFVTLVTHERAHLFGAVVDGAMQLNEAGRIAEQCWKAIPHHFPHVTLDVFVIMPNHIHGILWIIQTVGAKNFSPLPTHSPRPIPSGTSKTIGSVVRGFKTGVTKWFRQNTPIYPVWQRNYFEHIIRTERALDLIRRYIAENPLRWELDRYNPERKGTDPLASEIWAIMTEGEKHPSSLLPTGYTEDIA
ncbi:MAG: transposase [Anaerolineae bacterium]|uniref:transposase n=1 Tax=Thermoflexus sp. TaxID=1969742 RepID=UPI00299778EB|nr:transposase [Anaerolineae bacterium]MDW8186386.1 transposase [Anaerolineae bacterium]